MTAKERRRAVRRPARLAMEIKLGGSGQAQVQSINVSANGVYFSTESHIPPLTRLQITLILPEAGPDGAKREVNCEGVVVRTEPEDPRPGQNNYEIACYFTAISDEDKDDLETYILNQLTF